MSFANILGQLLEQGIAGQNQTRRRVGTSAQNLAQGSPGVEQILGALQSALGGRGSSQGGPAGMAASGSAHGNSLGGLAQVAKTYLGQPQVGGMSGAQVGGLGAIAGALLGGGGGAMRGAAGGGAMAILGTLALTALKNARAGPPAARFAETAPARKEVAAVTSEEGERLALRAMIAAAKADGNIDQAEMDRILGHLESDEVTEAERRFVLDEIGKPLDSADLARDVRTPAQAAEVYAASLLAIDIDSEGEREYLRSLAKALRLDPGVVSFLHKTTGAPASAA